MSLTAKSRLQSIKMMKIEDVKKLYLYMMQPERGQDILMPLTTCVLYCGGSIEDADYFYLVVERKHLFSTCNAEGLIVLLRAYWLFNFCYSSDTFNTLLLLERLYLKMNVTTPRTVVTKFLNRIVKKHSVASADVQET